jgi:hypothetical protein
MTDQVVPATPTQPPAPGTPAAAHGSVEQCRLAKKEHREALKFLGLWNFLLFAVGAVVTIILIVLLVWALIDQKWAVAGGTAVAGLLQGGLLNFLTKQRGEAKKQLAEARAFVKTACTSDDAGGAGAGELTDIERPYKVFGVLD